MNKEEQKWKKEYSEFMSLDVNGVAKTTAHDEILKELDPSWADVLLRLLFLHLLMSSATLLVCPQFGIGPLGGGHGVMAFIEPYGHLACGAFCGTFFFLGSVLLTRLIFSTAYQRKLKSTLFGSYAILAFVSLGSLLTISFMLGGHWPHLHAGFLLTWLTAGVGFSTLLSAFLLKGKLKPLSVTQF